MHAHCGIKIRHVTARDFFCFINNQICANERLRRKLSDVNRSRSWVIDGSSPKKSFQAPLPKGSNAVSDIVCHTALEAMGFTECSLFQKGQTSLIIGRKLH
ncbi:hypothetical protein BUE93_03435 [Chromobacterium amazonense]|uniref:Uncharacterized protein n=1 Tax=Chromobacterium amazonense TaxID=1382803 RepID=A0A2S9X8B4_9NEIS|nr:hypothetical protein BUE93_03435 [Chromobacterium amazonense]